METWSYLEPHEKSFSPALLAKQSGTEARNTDGHAKREYWLVDGRVHDREQNLGVDVPEESREMRNIEARIRHMDELEVDVQILFPTLMLRPIVDRAPMEFALCRSYNRWLADIWKMGRGRLRWVAVPPILSLDKARAELEYCKENGACGIFMRCLENERPITDNYFDPLYEIAGDLDLPIAIHLGNGSFTTHGFYTKDTTFTKFKLPTIGAFHSLIMHGTPSRFPKVRWGLIEASANWLPYVLNDLRQRFARRGKDLPADVLGANNIYVTCEVKDDLPHILKTVGPDNLIIGTDYGHSDSSTEIEALRLLRDESGIGAATVDKILWHNPRRFYGLE
jgi:predicted TIM-barrel fold metal-dependent hydrolase